MITKEKEMKISQTNRADSVPQEPKSALRALMQRLSLTLLACTLTIGVTEAQQVAPPIPGVIGKVQSFTGSSLDVQTPSGVVHVNVKQPLTTYKQIPSDLSHVTSASYIGVASTEQADGKEVAKQIIIFPAELSGAAEGSVLTDPPGATYSQQNDQWLRLSPCRIALTHDKRHGTERQRHHPGSPVSGRLQDDLRASNVPVVEVAPEQVTFATSDIVYAATEKLPSGTLMTDKIFLIVAAASPDAKQ